MPRRLECHFNEGLMLTARIGLDMKLNLDFSNGNQDFSKMYSWVVGVNPKGGYLYNFSFKTVKLTSVNSLNFSFVYSLLTNFQNVESLIIEKSSCLVLAVDSLSKLVNLTIRDCDLDSLSVDALDLKSLRYSGSLGRIRFYKVMTLEDVMFDFKLGPSLYGEKERFDYAVLISITHVRVLTLHGWMYKGFFEPWLSLNEHFTLGKLEDLWWIDSCMEDDNVNWLFCFLKFCPSLKRLFITIDPRRYLFPKPSTADHESSKCIQKGKLDMLKMVKLEGFTEKDIISFKELLMKAFNFQLNSIVMKPGMPSKSLMRVTTNSKSLRFYYRFLDEVDVKHPHMP